MNTDGPITFTGLIKFLQYIKGPDHWHNVGDTGEPAFEDSWVNLGGDWQDARFIKDVSGVVHMQGIVKDGTVGTTNAIFTLPVGYRPTDKNLVFIVESNDAEDRLDVYPSGVVCPYRGNNASFALNVSFYVG